MVRFLAMNVLCGINFLISYKIKVAKLSHAKIIALYLIYSQEDNADSFQFSGEKGKMENTR